MPFLYKYSIVNKEVWFMAPSIFARFRPAPLSSGFFLTSIFGLLITLFYFDGLTATQFGKSITLAVIIIFIAMFVAAMISMRRAPVSAIFALDHHVVNSGRTPSRAQVAGSVKKVSARKPARKPASRPAQKAKPAKKAKSRKPARKMKRKPARKAGKKRSRR